MAQPTSEETLERVLELISRRTDTYQTGVQTTVCWNSDSGWLNSITKLEFIRKDEKPPEELTNKYQSIQIFRRYLTPNKVGTFLKKLVEKHSLEIGADTKELSYDARFSIGVELGTRIPNGRNGLPIYLRFSRAIRVGRPTKH